MHANNKGAGLYSYPRSLISAFIVRLLESIISKLASCKISFYLVSVAEQTGLGLTQPETRKIGFSRDGHVSYHLLKIEDPVLECKHRPCRPCIRAKLTRPFTVRIRIVWKEIIDTVYVIMYDLHSP